MWENSVSSLIHRHWQEGKSRPLPPVFKSAAMADNCTSPEPNNQLQQLRI